MPEEITTAQHSSTTEELSNHDPHCLGLARFEGEALKSFRENFTTADLRQVEKLAHSMISKHFPTLRPDKDELVQETLKNFINRGLANYSPEKGELVGYFYTIMRNTAAKLLQHKHKMNRTEPAEILSETLPLSFSTLGDSFKELQPVPIQLADREWTDQLENLLHMALPDRQTGELTKDRILPEEVHGFIWTRFTKKTLGEGEQTLIAQATDLATPEKPPLEYLQEAIEYGLTQLSLPARQLLADVSINKVSYQELVHSHAKSSESPHTFVKMRIFRARRKVLLEASEYLCPSDSALHEPKDSPAE
ncbi:MAG: hypothetical protein ACO3XO_04460 [Bdellovibrionota bacterium]